MFSLNKVYDKIWHLNFESGYDLNLHFDNLFLSIIFCLAEYGLKFDNAQHCLKDSSCILLHLKCEVGII